MTGSNLSRSDSQAKGLKEPIILGNAIHSQGDYDVFVGSPVEDAFPMYVVINRQHSVIEYTNEVLPLVKDWLNHFSPTVGDGKQTAKPGLN